MKNKSKVSLLGFFCNCFIILISVATMVQATDMIVARKPSTQLKVGDNEGWREPDANHTDMYTQWATKNRFKVGDSLLFEYKNDSVIEVEKQGYYHCNLTNPLASFDDGKTVIKLDKPGSFYFISGFLDHCKNGQRLLIDVINPNQPPPPPPEKPTRPPPPSIAVPPQPYITDLSPSPSPLSNGGFKAVASSFPILMALVMVISMV